MKIFQCISNLIDYAVRNLCLDELNVNYVRNNVLDILSLRTYQETPPSNVSDDIQCLLDEFVSVATEEGVFEAADAPYFCDKIMGALSLSPAELNAKFQSIAEKSTKQATDFLYKYCVDNNYVKKAVLDKNPRFSADNGLVVTINLSKPEFRDPNKAKSGNSVQGGYPSCVICRENEGYAPRGKSTLRTVSIKLDGKDWFWQYSPYGYFNEHGIAVNTAHIPMKVDGQTFANLLDFVDIFPHYFIGCNAPLERIGGSVLAHDHYQGGGEVLPLRKAEVSKFFTFADCDDLTVGIVNWSGSVVRLTSGNKASIIKAADAIRSAWVNYDNEKLGIVSGKDGVRFSEISPTAYKEGDVYHMDIILRNNGVTKEYPDGVFHAHPEFHVIKKESIGLIEAQGLFILPGRLNAQLAEVEQAVTSGKGLPEHLAEFETVYGEICQTVKNGEKDVDKATRKVLASICDRILKNTAVFKEEKDFIKFLEENCRCKKIDYKYKISAGGRVNIIGEHVDYCGGKVLPAALSLKCTVYAKPNQTDKINVRWTTLPQKVTLDINNLANYKDVPHANYIAGCAYNWQQSGKKVVGCDLIYHCTVPFGSGLSSSAAIEVSTLATLAALSGTELNKKEIALLAQKTEREYAGVNCGIMDQYASSFGKKDNAILLDCKAVEHRYAPVALGDYVLVISNTNKPHSLVTSKYNERRAETEQGLALLKHKLDVSCLADVTPRQFEQYKHLLSGKILDRVEHVVYECERVNQAVEAMKNGDLVTLGRLLNESHASLRDKYEVSCAELDVLAQNAQNYPDCLGSRMTGAGFGGSTVSIVKKDKVDDFIKRIGKIYRDTIGYEATFYQAEVSDGIIIENL